MASEVLLTSEVSGTWQQEAPGPATVTEVMADVEARLVNGDASRLLPLPTGFSPLDEILNGGLRPGELLVIGGPFGVGKTIFGLQVARNVAASDPSSYAIYVCYEHDRTHLLSRLLCLESALQGAGENALTLRRITELAGMGSHGLGTLAQISDYTATMAALKGYADRLVLVKASGSTSTLQQIETWVRELATPQLKRVLLVVDYLQKIPIDRPFLESEEDATTYLAQGLKELAISLGIRLIALVASDRPGLQSRRMRLTDLRGSSALQYEADVGLVLNNKHAIVSREHLVYNLMQAEAMRNWVVMSVEKNRAGRNSVDMEYAMDAAHFHMLTEGRFVRERLIDEKVIRE
ncbi:MAG: helicase DnaB [Anaerolineae bacterium]|nr:helicase DnaB [Anaerolineae bacterium]